VVAKPQGLVAGSMLVKEPECNMISKVRNIKALRVLDCMNIGIMNSN
jgi:hypothetical protein